MEESNISLSKHYLSYEIIKKIYEKSFNNSSDNISISILSGGIESAVYLIDDNISKKVLKIAPQDNSGTISADKNTLWWEAKMLKLMEKINFPSPRLLHYEEQCDICSSPYIFMTYIDGKNYLENKEKLTSREIENIEYQIGMLSSKISSVKSSRFLLPSDPTKEFINNFEFISHLFELLFNDAKSNDLDLNNIEYKIYNILKIRENSLNNITNLCLNHTDIWDGNILINNGVITGVVDFSDLYYCDELMTFYFHTIDGKTSEAFLRGYGKNNLNYDEKIRIEIYRMYIILKMIIECKIKKYGKFEWMYDNLSDKIRKIRTVKEFIMNNYIFGVGPFANKTVEQFINFGINVHGFLELKDFYMPISIEKHDKIPTYFAEDLLELDRTTTNIIITQKPIIMGDTIEFLKKNNFNNIYIVSEDLLLTESETLEDMLKHFYKINLDKPFLNYLEMNIVDHCNLNCKGCAHFSNISDSNFVELDSLEKDLKLIAEKFNLYYFRLLGGEPLLHPNIAQIVQMTRSILKDTKIVIVTNGLLINKLSNDIMKVFYDNNITSGISVYNPTYTIIDDIIKRLEDFNINYILNDNYDFNKAPIESFQTRLTDKNINNGKNSSKVCVGRFCRFLRDGKISKCYYPLLIDILNKKYGTNYILSGSDYIELASIMNGWEAIEQLNMPIPFCNYCSEQEHDFMWESGVMKNEDIYQYILKR